MLVHSAARAPTHTHTHIHLYFGVLSRLYKWNYNPISHRVYNTGFPIIILCVQTQRRCFIEATLWLSFYEIVDFKLISAINVIHPFQSYLYILPSGGNQTCCCYLSQSPLCDWLLPVVGALITLDWPFQFIVRRHERSAVRTTDPAPQSGLRLLQTVSLPCYGCELLTTTKRQ